MKRQNPRLDLSQIAYSLVFHDNLYNSIGFNFSRSASCARMKINKRILCLTLFIYHEDRHIQDWRGKPEDAGSNPAGSGSLEVYSQ